MQIAPRDVPLARGASGEEMDTWFSSVFNDEWVRLLHDAGGSKEESKAEPLQQACQAWLAEWEDCEASVADEA
eukprot:7030927-Alexandrium_andersonii.AAC.1